MSVFDFSFLLLIFSLIFTTIYSYPMTDLRQSHDVDYVRFMNYLFPNETEIQRITTPTYLQKTKHPSLSNTFPSIFHSSHESRHLIQQVPIIDDAVGEVTLPKYPCTICKNLDYCKIINGKQVEEKYYPKDLQKSGGTCDVIEDLGRRISQTGFGPGRSFRDTPECRDMVLQYMCLFWSSDNLMYSNLCINHEDVSSADKSQWRLAPRYPCRSFCVQIALVCAYDPTFPQLCASIACPPTSDACTPNPTIGSNMMDANMMCQLPYEINPYAIPRGTGFKLFHQTWIVFILAVLMMVFIF